MKRKLGAVFLGLREDPATRRALTAAVLQCEAIARYIDCTGTEGRWKALVSNL